MNACPFLKNQPSLKEYLELTASITIHPRPCTLVSISHHSWNSLFEGHLLMTFPQSLPSVYSTKLTIVEYCFFSSNSFFPSSSAPTPLLPSNVSLVSLGCPFHPRGYALSAFSLDSSASASPAILTVFTSKYPLDSCPVGVWCVLLTHCSSFLSVTHPPTPASLSVCV